MYCLFPEQEQTSWQCVWSATTAIPVVHLAFSPDGTLFAACGENDRLVKIWYENRHGECLCKCMILIIICYCNWFHSHGVFVKCNFKESIIFQIYILMTRMHKEI